MTPAAGSSSAAAADDDDDDTWAASSAANDSVSAVPAMTPTAGSSADNGNGGSQPPQPPSSSLSSSSEDDRAKISSLLRQLADLRASKKAADDAGAARERKLESDVSDLAALKKAGDDAGAARERKLESDVAYLVAAKKAGDDAGAARELKLEDDIAFMKERKMEAKYEGDERERKLRERVDALLLEKEKAAEAEAEADGGNDVGASRRELEGRLDALRAKVEQAMFQKHLADEEVDRLKKAASSSGCGSQTESSATLLSTENEALIAQLKEAELRLAALGEQKKTAEDNAAAKAKADADDRDALQTVLRSLQGQLDAMASTKAETDGKHREDMDELMSEVRRMKDELDDASYARFLAESELGRVKASASASASAGLAGSGDANAAGSSNSSLNVESLATQLKSARDEYAALKLKSDAKEEEDRTDRDAMQAVVNDLRHRLDEAKFAKLMTGEEHKAAMHALREQLKSMKGDLDSATFAKDLAESEMDKALTAAAAAVSSSSGGGGGDNDSGSSVLEDQLTALRKELYDSKIAGKAREDSGAAREMDLRSELRDLKERSEEEKRATAEKAKSRIDELKDKVSHLQEEMEAAVRAKREAEEREAEERAKNSNGGGSGSNCSSSAEGQLQTKLDELRASKKVHDEAGAALVAKLESDLTELRARKEAGDDAGAEREEKLREQVRALRDAANEAAYAKLQTAGDHRAAMDDAAEKEKELERRLQSLREEVEAAVYEKYLATEELEKIKTSSGSRTESSATDHDEVLLAQLKSAEEEIAALREKGREAKESADMKAKTDKDDRDALEAGLRGLEKELGDAKVKESFVKGEHDALVSELREKLRSLKGDLDSATFAKYLAENELVNALASACDQGGGGGGSSSESVLALLRKELYDTKIAGKAREDAGTARESDLRMQLQTIKEEADVAASAAADAARAAADDALAAKVKADEAKVKADEREDALERKIKDLQEEVEVAVLAKYEAEKESDKNSSAGNGSSSAEARLQLELNELTASKKVHDEAGAALVAKLESELAGLRARKKKADDAGAEREEKLRERVRDLQDAADEASYSKLQTAEDHKMAMDEAVGKEEELKRRLRALQEEVEVAVYQKHLADDELERIRASGGSETTGSSEAVDELSALLKSVRDEAARVKETSDAAKADLHERIKFLESLLNFDKDGQLKAFLDEKRETHARLKENEDAAVAAKVLADATLKAAKDDAAAEKLKFDFDKGELEEKIESLNALMKSMEYKSGEDKRESDEIILRLKEELGLLKDQGAVMFSGKLAAEEEVRLLKLMSSEEGSSGSLGSSSLKEMLLLQQIEQLKAEKKLSHNLAAAMKRRLELDKGNLAKRLTEMKGLADDMAAAKKEAEDKLVVKESSESHSSSDAKEIEEKMQKEMAELKVQEEAIRLELKKHISALQEELRVAKSSPGSHVSGASELQEEVTRLLGDLDKMKSKQASTEKRLEWEKASKRALRDKILSLQEHADEAARAKKASEDELRKLQEKSETLTSSSIQDLAAELRAQIDILQEEKEETMQKVEALELAIATGDDFGEGAHAREAYTEKLKNDIELLEASVTHLTEENIGLLATKGRLEGEICSQSGEEERAKFSALDVEIKHLTSLTKSLEGKLAVAVKEAGDARLAEKEEKDNVLDLQARMDRTILQLATLKSSTRMNMEKIKEDHEEEVKAAKESGSARMQMELDALRQRLKAEEESAAKSRVERARLMADLGAERDRIRNERDALRKSLEVEKAARSAAEAAIRSTTSSVVDMENNFASSSGNHVALKKLREANSRLEQSLREVRAKNEELECGLKAAQSRSEEKDVSAKILNDLKKQLKDLTKRNAELIEENATLTEERRKFERENSTLIESVKQSDTAMTRMRNEIVELRTTADAGVARLEGEKQGLQQENQGLQEANQRLQQEIHGLRQANQALQRERKALHKDVGKSREETGKLQREVEVLQKQQAVASESAPRRDQDASRVSTELVSAVAQDSIIVDFQGSTNSGMTAAASGADFVAHITRTLQNERDLRLKAEAIAATLGQRIKTLKTRMSILEAAEKKAGASRMVTGSAANGDISFSVGSSSAQQLGNAAEELERLRSIVGHLKWLYEMKEASLQEVETERDALRLEIMKYRGGF